MPVSSLYDEDCHTRAEAKRLTPKSESAFRLSKIDVEACGSLVARRSVRDLPWRKGALPTFDPGEAIPMFPKGADPPGPEDRS